MIPLERGLIAFKAGDFFLSAIPDGRISLSAPVCSTWELFLASEDWCTDAPATGDEWIENTAGAKFDKKGIKSYIVHPANKSQGEHETKSRKVLIYGYTKWSHGRVYYDLCKHLHQRGYIVDILDWQVNHADNIGEIIPYYDLFMTALDGVRALVDSYRVPYDKIIAVSHGEFDIRMLIEQKGIEVFDQFANYGVVSEFSVLRVIDAGRDESSDGRIGGNQLFGISRRNSRASHDGGICIIHVTQDLWRRV